MRGYGCGCGCGDRPAVMRGLTIKIDAQNTTLLGEILAGQLLLPMLIDKQQQQQEQGYRDT